MAEVIMSAGQLGEMSCARHEGTAMCYESYMTYMSICNLYALMSISISGFNISSVGTVHACRAW